MTNMGIWNLTAITSARICFAGALRRNSFPEAGRILRENGKDRVIRRLLADWLDSACYIWKRRWGRPNIRVPDRHDPLEIAMQDGNISVIVDHLRHSDEDPRITTWLGDQFDRRSPRDSRFVPKPSRKKPQKVEASKKKLRVGEFIERSIQQGLPRKAAVSDAMAQAGISRATAYRYHKEQRDHKKRTHLVGSRKRSSER
jgi:hypothetical protein